MRQIVKPISTLFLASSLLLSTLPLSAMAQTSDSFQLAWFQAAKAKPSLEYDHFKLKNGLNVYLTRNPLEPRFQAQVVVNAGGKQDPANATGIAHYLEHMLFKGTDQLGTNNFAAEKVIQDQIVGLYDQLFKATDDAQRNQLNLQINELSIKASQYAIPGELDSIYSRLGAQGLNAYTSNEETVYLLSLPKNRIEQWAKVESERYRQPVFRLFQSELETVYEEKNRSLDNKESVLHEAVQAQLYKKHPYGTQTILGSVEHLKNPSLTEMYTFYRKYYVPNNMAIVISGDIDLKETRKVIEKYFSSWEARPVPEFDVPQEPPIQGIERVETQYKGEEKVLLSFRTAPYGHPDADALTMIDMLLDSGDVGLIKINLVQPQLVRGAGSYPSLERDYGSQSLHAVPREGQSLAEVEQLLLDQVEKIKQGQFDPEIMKAIALSYEISKKAALESNQARAGILTQAFLKGQTVEEIMNQAERLKKLKPEDIVRVAKKYFQNNYVVGYRHDAEYDFPKINKPTLKKVNLNPNQSSPFAQAVAAIDTPPVEPKWIDIKETLQASSYAPGVLYYYSQNPINDLFSFSISYDYGDKHHPNFCAVMSELNAAGTGEMLPQAVSQQFYKLGASASFGCSDYGFSMSISGTDEKFEPALKLAEEVLWKAQLNESYLQKKIENQITNRKDEKKDLQTLRQALRSWVRYGAESGYLDRPSEAELKQINAGLYPQMTQALQKQNFEVHYIGQLPKDKVEKLVKQYHQPQAIPVPLLNPRKMPPVEIMKRHDKPVKIYFLHHESAQSNIDAIIPGDLVKPEQAVLSSFYNEYMDGGMGAIMFQEVRESRALAYSTWAFESLGSRLGDQGQVMAYIGTQADKTNESLALLIDLLRNPPKSASHFERAKQSLDNNYRTSRVSFREIFGTVESWKNWGFSEDPRAANFAQLSQVQLDDIFTHIKDKISSRPLTFTIVGDRTKIDLTALKKLGDVEEVKIDQLFHD